MVKFKKLKALWRQLGFQLNQNDKEDSERLVIVAWLAKQKKKNTVLRDGLDIVYSLRYLNDPAPLLKHFPNIADLITMHSDPMLKAIYEQQLENHKLLLELKENGVSVESIVAPGSAKPLAGLSKVVPMPVLDDDDGDTIVIKVDENAAAQAKANFLNSLAAILESDSSKAAD